VRRVGASGNQASLVTGCSGKSRGQKRKSGLELLCDNSVYHGSRIKVISVPRSALLDRLTLWCSALREVWLWVDSSDRGTAI
jgi:hypothetical protein